MKALQFYHKNDKLSCLLLSTSATDLNNLVFTTLKFEFILDLNSDFNYAELKIYTLLFSLLLADVIQNVCTLNLS